MMFLQSALQNVQKIEYSATATGEQQRFPFNAFIRLNTDKAACRDKR